MRGRNFLERKFSPSRSLFKELATGVIFIFLHSALDVERRMFAQTNAFLQITKTTCTKM